MASLKNLKRDPGLRSFLNNLGIVPSAFPVPGRLAGHMNPLEGCVISLDWTWEIHKWIGFEIGFHKYCKTSALGIWHKDDTSSYG